MIPTKILQLIKKLSLKTKREDEELNMRDWSYLTKFRKHTDPDEPLDVQTDISTLKSLVKNFCMNTLVTLLLCMRIKQKTSLKLSFLTFYGEWSRLSHHH